MRVSGFFVFPDSLRPVVAETQIPFVGGLQAYLGKSGIGADRRDSEPPRPAAAFASLGHGEGSFPLVGSTANGLLSLPMYPCGRDSGKA